MTIDTTRLRAATLAPTRDEVDALLDEIDRLRAERDELNEVRMAIGGDAYWMDPPDGGNVTLAEMVARADAAGRLADEALRLLREAMAYIDDDERPAPAGIELSDRIYALLAKVQP